MFFGVPAEIGYLGVFLLVAGETADALVPGETALIVAGALASRGELSLPLVIAAGAAGAIVGDNVGFVVGGRGLRFLLTTGGRWPASAPGLSPRVSDFSRATARRLFCLHAGFRDFDLSVPGSPAAPACAGVSLPSGTWSGVSLGRHPSAPAPICPGGLRAGLLGLWGSLSVPCSSSHSGRPSRAGECVTSARTAVRSEAGRPSRRSSPGGSTLFVSRPGPVARRGWCG